MATSPRRSLIAIALVGFAFTLTACGKAGEMGMEKIIESQGGGNVDLDLDGDKGFSVQTEDGGMTIDKDGNFVITDASGSIVTGRADADDGSYSVESDDGDFSYGTTDEIPDSWPTNVPRPDDLSITSVTSIESTDGNSFQLAGTTADIDRFVAGYVAQLEAGGFTSEASSDYDGEPSWTAVFDGPFGVILTVLAYEGEDPIVSVMVIPSSATDE